MAGRPRKPPLNLPIPGTDILDSAKTRLENSAKETISDVMQDALDKIAPKKIVPVDMVPHVPVNSPPIVMDIREDIVTPLSDQGIVKIGQRAKLPPTTYMTLLEQSRLTGKPIDVIIQEAIDEKARKMGIRAGVFFDPQKGAEFVPQPQQYPLDGQPQPNGNKLTVKDALQAQQERIAMKMLSQGTDGDDLNLNDIMKYHFSMMMLEKMTGGGSNDKMLEEIKRLAERLTESKKEDPEVRDLKDKLERVLDDKKYDDIKQELRMLRDSKQPDPFHTIKEIEKIKADKDRELEQMRIQHDGMRMEFDQRERERVTEQLNDLKRKLEQDSDSMGIDKRLKSKLHDALTSKIDDLISGKSEKKSMLGEVGETLSEVLRAGEPILKPIAEKIGDAMADKMKAQPMALNPPIPSQEQLLQSPQQMPSQLAPMQSTIQRGDVTGFINPEGKRVVELNADKVDGYIRDPTPSKEKLY